MSEELGAGPFCLDDQGLWMVSNLNAFGIGLHPTGSKAPHLHHFPHEPSCSSPEPVWLKQFKVRFTAHEKLSKLGIKLDGGAPGGSVG